MTRDQMDKLQRAALQIAEVQAELLFEDEKLPVPEQNDEHWRRLYRIHTQLGELHGLDERLGGLGRGDFRMAKRTIHGKRFETKVEDWSTDETVFPDAWEEILADLNRYKKERVVSFRVKVYLAPDEPVPKAVPEGEAKPFKELPEAYNLVSDLLGKYLNTMVADLRIEGKGQYLRDLFSQYEAELRATPPTNPVSTAGMTAEEAFGWAWRAAHVLAEKGKR